MVSYFIPKYIYINGQLLYPYAVQRMNGRGKPASYRGLTTSPNSMNHKPMFLLPYNSDTISYNTITTVMLKEYLVALAALRLLVYNSSHWILAYMHRYFIFLLYPLYLYLFVGRVIINRPLSLPYSKASVYSLLLILIIINIYIYIYTHTHTKSLSLTLLTLFTHKPSLSHSHSLSHYSLTLSLSSLSIYR